MNYSLIFFIAFYLSNFLSCFGQLNIQSLINDAILNKKSEIILPNGTYTISTPIVIFGANRLTLKGSGVKATKLIFNNPLASSTNYDILIQGSTNVTIENIQIDHDPLPFTQGSVIDIDLSKNWFDLAIHAGYSKDPARFGYNSYIHVHDPNTRRFKQEGEMTYASRTEITNEGLRVYLQGKTDYSNIQINDLISIGQPGFGCAISLFNARNTLIDNVNIVSAPGCGILENGGSGSVIDSLTIMRGSKPASAAEDRLISINRDGLHLNGPNGGTIVRNCFIEFCGDDAINIRSTFPRITSVSGNNIRNSISHTNFEPSTHLYVYNFTDLTLKDTVRVSQHLIGSDIATVDRAENIQIGDLIVSPEHTQNFKILNQLD